MATEQRSRKSASGKIDAFVTQQLRQVQSRLHWIDVGQALLALTLTVLAYAFGMALFDLAVDGSAGGWITTFRLTAFGLFVLSALASFAILLVRLNRRINPYYAARQLEQSIPDAKNSVINWLDLKDEKLPGPIRQAVGQRAAEDLQEADPDEAANPRPLWILTGLVSVLLIALGFLFLRSPGQFGSLMSRAFAPFADFRLASQTQIHLIRPQPADAIVPPRQRVDFAVQIEGRFPGVNQPGAPTLHFRYHPQDDFVAIPLEEDLAGGWSARLLADQVQNGLWYKITAGDAATPEHQIKVRPEPLVSRFEVGYTYRPYLMVKPETVAFPNERAVFPRIKGYRGTEVTITAHTNSRVKQGRIEIDIDGQKKIIPASVLPDRPQTLMGQFVLEKSGTWTLAFVTENDESNIDRRPYDLEVLQDKNPRVELTEPGKDVALPANAGLPLVGEAIDDLGIQSLTLQLRAENGPLLQGKPYRPGKSFRFDNGTYPDRLAYRDFLKLDSLKDAKGQPYRPAENSVLEYWLEALDNHDFPKPNLGKSQVYKIKILPPSKEEQKQEQKENDQDQKEHEQQQDQKLQKENQKRNQQQGKKDQPQEAEGKQSDPEPGSKQEEQKDRLKELLDRIAQKREQEQKEKSGESEKKEPAERGPMPQPAKENASEKKEPGQGDPQPKITPEEKKEPAGKEEAKQKQGGEEAKSGKQPEAKQDPGKEPTGGKKKNDESKKEPGGKDEPMAGKQPEPKQDPSKQPASAKKEESPAKKSQPTSKEDSKKDPNQAQSKEVDPKQQAGKEGDPKQEQAKEKSGDPQKIVEEKKLAGKTNPDGKEPGDSKDLSQGTKKEEVAPKKGEPKEGENPLAKLDPKDQLKNPQEKKSGKELSPEEFAKRLEEFLKKKDPDSDQMARDLAKKAQETDDPQLKKEIEDFLKKSGREKELEQARKDHPQPKNEPGQAKQEKADPEKGPMPEKVDPQQAKDSKDKKDNSKEPTARQKKEGDFGPNSTGVADKNDPQKVDEALSRRGGNLTLEDVKKYVTPEMLKEVGMSAEEYQKFLAEAAKHQDWLKTLQKNQAKDQIRGDPQKMQSSSRKVENANPQSGTIQGIQAEPPPEFRDAFLKFTSPPKK